MILYTIQIKRPENVVLWNPKGDYHLKYVRFGLIAAYADADFMLIAAYADADFMWFSSWKDGRRISDIKCVLRSPDPE